MVNPISCPCGAAKNYQDCCGIYHQKLATATTAEALMRSRYTAFSLNDIDYIQATQKLSVDESEEEKDAIKKENSTTKWTRLEILHTEQGMEKDETGTVTFRAYFEEEKHQGELSEKSLFNKINGQWFYVSGTHQVNSTPTKTPPTENMKIGRNEPCLCGSGKKFKKCCG